MLDVRSLITALLERLGPAARVVRGSRQTRELAGILNRRPKLDAKLMRAIEIAREAAFSDDTPCPSGFGNYATIGQHAAAASSRNDKLAMLVALARWRRAETALEIGTAYGISGIALGSVTRLTTVEGFEPQATIGPRNIAAAGVEANCIRGRKEGVIPQLVRDMKKFDLVFHDGGHTGDAYVADYEAMLPMLNPGAVFVVDDVFHDDSPVQRARTKSASRRSCREGWNELLNHHSIEGVVLFRGKVGVLILAP